MNYSNHIGNINKSDFILSILQPISPTSQSKKGLYFPNFDIFSQSRKEKT